MWRCPDNVNGYQFEIETVSEVSDSEDDDSLLDVAAREENDKRRRAAIVDAVRKIDGNYDGKKPIDEHFKTYDGNLISNTCEGSYGNRYLKALSGSKLRNWCLKRATYLPPRQTSALEDTGGMCLSGTVEHFLEVTEPLAADAKRVPQLSTVDFTSKNYFMFPWKIFVTELRSA